MKVITREADLGTFIDHQGKLKNSLLIKGFSLSFLFLCIFLLGYMLSADLITRLFPAETGDFIDVWGPPALISLVCSLLCCSLMAFFTEKVIIPVAFLFIALFYVLFILATLTQNDPALRILGAQMVSIYALPAVVLGNILSWGLYFLYRRSRKNRIARVK